jgi:hypothetical protein
MSASVSAALPHMHANDLASQLDYSNVGQMTIGERGRGTSIRARWLVKCNEARSYQPG